LLRRSRRRRKKRRRMLGLDNGRSIIVNLVV
jgi:hypothetical protein